MLGISKRPEDRGGVVLVFCLEKGGQGGIEEFVAILSKGSARVDDAYVLQQVRWE